MTSDSARDHRLMFSDQSWTAGVIGLGYTGLPIAMAATRAGLACVGLDIAESKVATLGRGRSYVDDVSDEEVAKALAAGFYPTTSPDDLGAADALFICVPSPLGRNREPDMGPIRGAGETVARAVRRGTLVSLESTTYPGTTRDIILPAATNGGLRLDDEVFVAYSPERTSPGSEDLMTDIPKLVGGITATSGEVARSAYSRLAIQVHLVSSAEIAEMAKLLENTYRAVNIALINEFAQLAHRLEIDIWEVIEAASTKPFGYHPFYPGPGVGGHCIPLDPQYLTWRAKEVRFATPIIDAAEQTNLSLPGYAADRVADILNSRGSPVRDTRILGVGIAYKSNVSDDRESASVRVLQELQGRGAVISVIDPVVGSERISQHGFHPVGDSDELSGFQIAVILTDHDIIDLARIADDVPIVLDTRNALGRRGIHKPNVVNL